MYITILHACNNGACACISSITNKKPLQKVDRDSQNTAPNIINPNH